MDKSQGQIFLNTENVFVSNAQPFCFFLHIFQVKMSNFNCSITRDNKTKLALNLPQNFEAMV